MIAVRSDCWNALAPIDVSLLSGDNTSTTTNHGRESTLKAKVSSPKSSIANRKESGIIITTSQSLKTGREKRPNSTGTTSLSSSPNGKQDHDTTSTTIVQPPPAPPKSARGQFIGEISSSNSASASASTRQNSPKNANLKHILNSSDGFSEKYRSQ